MKRNFCLSLHASFPFHCFFLGEKTMKLNNDAVAKRCCCKAMLLQSDVVVKRCCCKAMLLNNGAIR